MRLKKNFTKRKRRSKRLKKFFHPLSLIASQQLLNNL
jgi:hypothetical protein